MKKSVILLFILFAGSNLLFCQTDSLGGSYIYPQFYDNFSAEESWEIHKEAYIKQLKSEGLTADAIEKKVEIYEKQKSEFIEKANERLRMAAIRRAEAEERRQEANEQRLQAAYRREQAARQREQADALREQADEQRKQSDRLRAQAEENSSLQREASRKLREQAKLQREESKKLREQAKLQREASEVLRDQADAQRRQAEILRKNAEEWRNSFENILTKVIRISSESSNPEPLIIKVTEKSTLLFKIDGEISSGAAVIEIFNPSGKKEGELSLGHKPKSSSINEGTRSTFTSGSLNQTISDASIGNWKVKVSGQKTEGTITISVAHYIKPTGNE